MAVFWRIVACVDESSFEFNPRERVRVGAIRDAFLSRMGLERRCRLAVANEAGGQEGEIRGGR